MLNSFQGLFLLAFQFQLLFHPIKPLFPHSFPFITTSTFPFPPSVTPTPTTLPFPSQTPTPTITVSPTPTPITTPVPTSTPILLPTLTMTPTPTAIPTPTTTPIPTITSVPTSTPSPHATPSPTPTIILTFTPTPTETPSPTITPSQTPTLTPTPSPSPTPEPIGNDISYPQCNKTYPSGQLFGIVGVNGGIASTTNPCLSSELTWAASTANSAVTQAKIQLYVNTGNPGGLNTATWPQNNTDPEGHGTTNPYGTCDGSNSTACAWQYGWNRAVDDVVNRFIPAANSAGVSSNPTEYPWWLDVETANSWRDGSDEALSANAADLEGMVAYFKSKDITPGLYSTSFQWGQIVGTVVSGSNLSGLPSWLPGASDLAGAKANCQKSPLTTGGKITLTQFTTGDFDYDYSCK
jgi:hypothetical protein